MLVRRIAALFVGCFLIGATAASPAAADDTPTSTHSQQGNGTVATATVVSVAFGEHATFDRAVVTFDKGVPPWAAQRIVGAKGKHGYEAGAYGQPPQAKKDQLQWLQVGVRADAGDLHDYSPGLPSIDRASLEGHEPDNGGLFIPMPTTVAFRVSTLTGPPRLVIDIAHPAGTPAQPVTTGQLPFTGSKVGWLALVGSLLVVIGAGMVFASRLRAKPIAPRGVA